MQGRCLICYPIGKAARGDAVVEELIMRRVELGRCESCEMLTSECGRPISNERTLLGRCLICRPLDDFALPRREVMATEAPHNEATNEFSRGGAGDTGAVISDVVSREGGIRNSSPKGCGGQANERIQAITSECNRSRQQSNARSEDDDGSATVVTSNVRVRRAGESARQELASSQASAIRVADVPSVAEKRREQCRRRKGNKPSPNKKAKKNKTAAADEEATLCAIADAKKQPGDASLQEETCELVKRSVNKQNAQRIVETGAIEMILSAMENHIDSTAVTIECMWALEKIVCVAEKYATEVAQDNGIQVIVTLLQKEFQNVRERKLVANAALKTLNHIVSTDVAVQKFIEAGGVEAVINTMRHYYKSPPIHTIACGIIQDVVNKNKGVVPAVVNAGVFSAIAAGMKKGATERMFGVLQNLLLDNESRLQFVKEGGLDVLMPHVWAKGMTNVPKMEAAAEAFFRLVSIGEDPPSNFVEGILVEAIEKYHGIEAVLNTMKKNSGVANIQSIGIQALYQMIFDRDSSLKAIDADCLPIVVDAMQRHISSGEVQESGCRTLGKIFEWVEVNNDRALGVIMSAMEKYPEEEGVQANACAALFEAYAKSACVRLSIDTKRLQGVLETADSKFPKACRRDVSKLIECSKETTVKKEQDRVYL